MQKISKKIVIPAIAAILLILVFAAIVLANQEIFADGRQTMVVFGKVIEPEIIILNPQSYPEIGSDWTVKFVTKGKADLTITAIDGTIFGKDINFSGVKCGEKTISARSIKNGFLFRDFECNKTGSEASIVLSSGKHHLKFSFGEKTAFANNSTPDWTAYNDCATSTGSTSTTNVTNISYASGGTGTLLKYADGTSTGVTFTIAGATLDSGGPEASSRGTSPMLYMNGDANTEFGAIVNIAGTTQTNTTYGSMTLKFTGLDSTKTYTLVLLAMRGAAAYNRTNRFVIKDITSFLSNSSSAGSTIDTNTIANDTTAYNGGDNWDNGYVTKWTGINPGADGNMLIVLSGIQPDTSSKPYINAIKLSQEASSGSPDVNISFPMDGETFNRDNTPTIDINLAISDTDTNAFDMNIDVNYSSTATQGTGTAIITDYNLALLDCDSNDLSAKRQCKYTWTISGIANGTYYILAKAKDQNGNSDYNSGANSFTITNNSFPPDVNVSFPMNNETYNKNIVSSIDINVAVSDPDTNTFDINIDINYSSTAVQGSGTSIISDYNLARLNCDNNNLSAKRQCKYAWTISGVPDGNYYIIAKVKDNQNGSDFSAGIKDFNIWHPKVIPDINISYPMNSESFDKTTVSTIDINIAISDADTNAFDMNIDLNYSATNTQGSGTAIITDYNLARLNCDSNNLSAKRQCKYTWAISGITNGTYYLLARAKDNTGLTDFNSGATTFTITGNATINKVQQATTAHVYGTTDLNITTTLSTGATSGNLIVSAVATDKNSGPYTMPAGFTQISQFTGASVSCAFAYKISTGGETTVTWVYDTNAESSSWTAEYSGTATNNVLDVSAAGNSINNNVSTQNTGVTATTAQAAELAVAIFGIDTASNVSTKSWNNSFTEEAFVGAGGTSGLSVADKNLSSTGTQDANFTWTGTVDQACAAIATFKAGTSTSSPDINVSFPQSGETFNTNNTPTIDINLSILDADTNTFNMTIDLNYSATNTQGSGSAIITDYNLALLNCDSNDLSAKRQCKYTWTITGLSNGTYYILAKAKDNSSNTDFNFGSATFIITGQSSSPDINISYPQSSELFNYSGTIDINFSISDQDSNASKILIDINYSKTAVEGTGTVILDDANLANSAITCDSNDLSTTRNCNYRFGLSTVKDGNYFILAKARDAQNNSDFNSGSRQFKVAGNPPKKQFILIGSDGMQVAHYQRIRDANLPYYVALTANNGFDGNVTITGHSSTSTAPGNAELHTGLPDSNTGITDNSCSVSVPAGTTIYERLRSFDANLHIGSVYGKETCYVPDSVLSNATASTELWDKPSTYAHNDWISGSYADSLSVMTEALTFISSHKDNSFYLVIYFGSPDGSGHAYGENSAGYNQALINDNNAIGMLLDAFTQYGINPKIIVSADHGWNTGTSGHGTNDINTVTIPLITNNSGLVGNIFGSQRKQCDIAPTILNYFGMTVSQYSDINDFNCGSMMSNQNLDRNFSPGISINYPTAGSFSQSQTIDINFQILDADTNASKIIIDLNYSASQTQGTGTSILQDTNLANSAIFCDNNNFSTVRNCTYQLNLNSVNTGNYYFLARVRDDTNNSDFFSTSSPVTISSSTITKVQQATASHTAGAGATSITTTLDSASTNGNLLVAAIATDKNAGPYTPPTGFTLISEYYSTNVSCAMAYKISTGGETALTWNYVPVNPTEESSAWTGEYSGTATSNVIDVNAKANSGTATVTTQNTGVTGTTSQETELVIAIAGVDSADTITTRSWNNDFNEQTFLGASSVAALSIADKNISTTGTQDANFTWTGTADQACAAIATFKAGTTTPATTSSPDINISFPMTQETFNKDNTPTIDINIAISDADTNAFDMNIDINYSTTNTQGTGTAIITDYNLALLNCDNNNLTAKRQCKYTWTISGITNGTYYILAKAKDNNGNSDFNGGTSTFTITSTASLDPGYHAKYGSFAKPASTTGNQSVTTVGFQPKVVIFFGNYLTADGNATSAKEFFGAATSSADRAAMASASTDAAATSTSDKRWSNALVITNITAGTPTVDAEADFVSMDSNGFTINWTTCDASQRIINYIALGGDELTNAKVGSFTAPITASDKAVTDVGFQPDAIIFFDNTLSTSPALAGNAVSSIFNIGFSVGTAKQNSRCAVRQDAQATSNTWSYQVTDSIQNTVNGSGAVARSATIKSLDSNGFTLTFNPAYATAVYLNYIALKGGQYDTGSFNEATSTGNQSVNTGFTPSGVIFQSAGNTTSAAVSSVSRISFGVGISSTERGSIWSGDLDAQADSVSDSDLNRERILRFLTEGTPVLNAEMDFVSNDVNGFTVSNTIADGTAREILYFAFGQARGASASPDANVLYPMNSESFDKTTVSAIDINISISDTDTNTFDLNIDINYSTTNTQGSGTAIITDYNLARLNCDNNNLTAKRQCKYTWTITGLSNGTYYILAKAKDNNGNSDFNSGAATFSITGGTNPPDINISFPQAGETFNRLNTQTIDINIAISDTDTNASDMNIDINYSALATQGTGTTILSGYNLALLNCDSNNLLAKRQCKYSWNIGSVQAGNYYIIAKATDKNSNNDFNSGAAAFTIIGTNKNIDANIWRIDENSTNNPMPIFSYITDGNLTIDFNIASDTNYGANFVDINFSTGKTQGSGTSIITNYQTDSNNCQTNFIGPWNNIPNSDINLIAYYKFDSQEDDYNSTRAVDYSANNNQGQFLNGADNNAAGKWDNNAAFFDGTNDVIQLSDTPFDLVQNFTIIAWINPGRLTLQSIACKSESSGYCLEISAANKANFRLHDGVSYKSAVGDNVLLTNQWYQIAGVLNGTEVSIYQDGVKQSTTATLAATVALNNYPLAFGANPGATYTDYYKGIIEEVKIYNRVLTAQEISLDYNLGKRNFRKGTIDWNISGITDANYYINILSKDNNGNSDFNSSNNSFRVNNGIGGNAPDANILIPNKAGFWGKGNNDHNHLVSFDVNNSTEGTYLYADIYYSTNAGQFENPAVLDLNLVAFGTNPTIDANCSGTDFTTTRQCWYDLNIFNWPDANYFIDINVFNESDLNKAVSSSYTVSIDNNAPFRPAIVSGLSSTKATTVNIEFFSTDNSSGIQKYWFKEDGAGWIDNGTSGSYQIGIGLVESLPVTKTYCIMATDNADNNSELYCSAITFEAATGGENPPEQPQEPQIPPQDNENQNNNSGNQTTEPAEKKELGNNCVSNADCKSEKCALGKCGECFSNNDCKDSQYCSSGLCLLVLGKCGIAENHEWTQWNCCQNSDCNSSQLCNTERHYCFTARKPRLEIQVFPKEIIEKKSFRVTVTDVNGSPVQNAIINIGNENGKTNNEGIFETSLSLGNYSLVATKEGFEKDTLQIEVKKEIKIVIKKAEEENNLMEIKSVDSAGNPVGGAEITIILENGTMQKMKTNENGLAYLQSFKDGKIQLSVMAEGYATAKETVPIEKEPLLNMYGIAVIAIIIVTATGIVVLRKQKKKKTN